MTAIPSNYKTIKETADAWGVTRRWVNMCVADVSVPGAVRMGNIWLVPGNAAKPDAASRRKKPPADPFEADLTAIIAATYAPVPHQDPDALLAATKDERHRRVLEIALGFWRATMTCPFAASGGLAGMTPRSSARVPPRCPRPSARGTTLFLRIRKRT